MPAAAVLLVHRAAAFEDVLEADDVRVDVRVRVRDRVAHARLRGEVHDAVEPVLHEQRLHARAVGDVHLHEREAALWYEAREPRLLQRRVVVVVEVVKTHNLLAAIEKDMRDMRADEARGTSDKNCHGRSLHAACRCDGCPRATGESRWTECAFAHLDHACNIRVAH